MRQLQAPKLHGYFAGNAVDETNSPCDKPYIKAIHQSCTKSSVREPTSYNEFNPSDVRQDTLDTLTLVPKFSIAEELRRQQQQAAWHDSEAMEWGAEGGPEKLKRTRFHIQHAENCWQCAKLSK